MLKSNVVLWLAAIGLVVGLACLGDAYTYLSYCSCTICDAYA